MKVWIENADRDPNELGGKSLFCCRLAAALRQLGVEVISDENKYVDASLNVIRVSHHNSRVRVLRLDGVYHNIDQDYTKRNVGIKAALYECDAIIYQSQHAKRLCDSFLGMVDRPYEVIYNGSDHLFYSLCRVNQKALNKKTFIAFGRWRPHKRLADIIGSYLLANVPNSQLIIAGDTSKSGISEKSYYSDRVFFVGKLDQTQLASWLLASRASIHLCWFDACPNSVVESLCAGVPVITNNVGGTPELLRAVGLERLICNVDEPYDYRPVHLYNPPAIDRRIVAQRIREVAEAEWVGFHNTPLRIKSIAKQYLNFFERLLR